MISGRSRHLAGDSRSASAVNGLMGEVGQQSAGHLPFERRATADGSFSILRTGTSAPLQTTRKSRRATASAATTASRVQPPNQSSFWYP